MGNYKRLDPVQLLRRKGNYQEEGITLIRSMNVHNGQFEYKDLAHISDEQASKLDNVTIEEDDVLLNIKVCFCCSVMCSSK